MRKHEIDDCVSVINSVIGFLLSSAPSWAAGGDAGAALRHDCGLLKAYAVNQVKDKSFAKSLYSCFEDVRLCGIDLPTMRNVLSKIEALTPVTLPGQLTVQTAAIYALSEISQIIAAMVFTARDTVETVLAQMNDDFDGSEESAADNNDQQVYQALIALHAAVTNHLVRTAQPLPWMVSYFYRKTLPSLTLSQRIYGDGTHADELRAENHVIHPAFMPMRGVALSPQN